MKISKFMFVASLMVSTFSYAQDPTADQVIDKYLAAIGGKDAISKIQDVTINTSAETQRGTMETEIKYKLPSKSATVMYMMGNEVNRTTCDGSKVQMVSGFGGNTNERTIEGADATIAIISGSLFPELLYDQFKIKRSITGKDTIAGKVAWKVGFETEDGKKWSESFDMETGLKVKKSGGMGGMMGGGNRGGQGGGGQFGQRQGGDGQGGGGGQRQGDGQGGQQRQGGMGGGGNRGGGTQLLSDYRELKEGSGVKIPYTREMGGGQFSMKSTVSSVKVNKGIKDNAFEVK